MSRKEDSFAENIVKETITARVYDVAIRTPLDGANALSGQLGNRVLLKREDLQPAFSFKVRGAFNRISRLADEEKAAGIICASAGNHAQGVAIAGRHLAISVAVVMPRTTPSIKVEAVKRQGAEVSLVGDSYSEAAAHALELARTTGRTFIHPFDDRHVIAGQATVGMEILEQCPDVDFVFVPVGGGGLIGGIAGFLKTLRPETTIVGVEPEDSNAMMASLEAGRRIELSEVGVFADGVAVKQVGGLAFELVQRFVAEIVTVSTDQICSAIKSIYEDTRSIMEPAGALGVAGLKKYVLERGVQGKTIVAVNSGANMNFNRLQFVAERTMTGEKREALFAVTIPEKPGALRLFCEQLVGGRNITEFNYRLSSRREAHIFVGISVEGGAQKEAFQRQLERQGFPAMDLTDDELAKTHIRHMVGGRARDLTGEVLYRFEFPERPDALADFLAAMSENWNISLFHYRMHGGDFGRVLVGFEIPEGDAAKFDDFLAALRYPYVEETANAAYKMFL